MRPYRPLRPIHRRLPAAAVVVCLSAALSLAACGGSRVERRQMPVLGNYVETQGVPLLNFDTRQGTYGAATSHDLNSKGRATLRHVEAYGKACRWGLSLPVLLNDSVDMFYASFDDGSYAQAYKRAYVNGKGQFNGADGTLIDVKADMHSIGVLIFFYRNCVELHGKYAVATAVAATAPAPAPASVVPAVESAATAASVVEPPVADTAITVPPATPAPQTTP